MLSPRILGIHFNRSWPTRLCDRPEDGGIAKRLTRRGNNQEPQMFSPAWRLGTSIRFSRTVIRFSSRGIWKVRTTPCRKISCGGSRSIRFPWKYICPSVHGPKPVIRLKRVVFPAPLGPINPVIVPGWTLNEQPLTARTPPKSFSTFLISRIGPDSFM